MDAASDDDDAGGDEPPRKGRHEVAVKSAARAAKRKKVADDQAVYEQSLHDIEKAKDRKKNVKKRAKDPSGDASIFNDEQVAYSQPKKNKDVVKSAYDFRGFDPNRKLGKKKGSKKFKSKAKHKRRK
jgi:hypothetical protein